MIKEFETQEMDEKEIKESLKLFSKLLKKEWLTYKHANPIQENCYISSSDIIGVYFPNTEFEQNIHPRYNLNSISKVNDELGIVFSLRDPQELGERARIYFSNYIFEPFETLLYSRSFLNVRKKIIKRVLNYKSELLTLEKIKRVYRKSGQDFANVLKNFEGVNMRFDFCILSPCVSSVVINYDQIRLYRKDELKKLSNVPTVGEIENLLQEQKKRVKNYLNESEKDLKNLEKNFAKFEKITEQLKNFRNTVNHYYDFDEEIRSMII